MSEDLYAKARRDYPIEDVLSRFYPDHRIKNHRLECIDPAHDDENPSASVFRADDGYGRFKCHACNLTLDCVQVVQMALGLPTQRDALKALMGEEIEPRQHHPKAAAPEFHLGPIPEDKVPAPGREFAYWNQEGQAKRVTCMVYVYRDEDGLAQGIVARIDKPDGKKIPFPIRWDTLTNRLVSVGWSKTQQPPLFGADRLAQQPDKPVVVVEGEKVASLLQAAIDTHVVVTWQGGCQQADRRNFSALAGRNVTYWPDADDNGIKAMKTVQARSSPAISAWITPREDWINHPTIKGYDAADLLDEAGIPAVEDVLTYRSEPQQSAPATAEEPQETNWLPPGYHLIATKEGDLKTTSEANHILFLSYHPLLKGRLKYDEFDQQVLLDGQEMTDMDVRHMVVTLCSKPFHLDVKSEKLASLLADIARMNTINRLGDSLRVLAAQWDGQPRYLLDYAGVETSEWSQIVSRRWGIGLAQRIMNPGCKHDGVLVLEGNQGIGKSTFLETLGASLGPDLYTATSTLHYKNNEAMALRGKAIVDMSELMALNKSEVEAFKAMTSARVDNYREPWGKRNRDFPRTCVFAGTTNKTKEYLNDPTGNRRVWPVIVVRWGDREAFARDKNQIWGELASRALAEEDSEMSGHESNLQKTEAELRETMDPWFPILEEVVNTRDEVPYEELWTNYLEVPKERRNAPMGKRVRELMDKLGWSKQQRTNKSTKKRYWAWAKA